MVRNNYDNNNSGTGAGTAVATNNSQSFEDDSQHQQQLQEQQAEQLSKDLALFLSNPSLQAALADGSLDLTSYSSTVEKELLELESQCIEVYRKKEKEINCLKTELHECDSIVLSLQEMLLGFQADLGGLSGEIRTLQEKSKVLATQLSNRHNATNGLSTFLSHIILSPNLIDTLTTGSVNSKEYVKCVKELQKLYTNTNPNTKAQNWSCNIPPYQTVAGNEMFKYIDDLRWVVVTRVREYFLQQLAHLRRPQTNIRIIQVHGLLQYSALQDFLMEASPQIATEIYNVYVESMSKTLFSLFRTYQIQLLQIDSTRTSATRHDVIAIDDASLRDSLTTKAKKRVDVFCLGNRANDVLLLDTNDDEEDYEDDDNNNDQHQKQQQRYRTPTAKRNTNTSTSPTKTNTANNSTLQPIVAHIAIREKISYPYERLFRSLLGHLVEAVTNEYVFCRQFFKCDAFGPLFNGTLSLLLEQIENYMFNCHDMLAILLMIKITHEFNRLLKHTRKIHSLDDFFKSIIQLLWPRLKSIMDSHRRSIKQSTASKLGGVDLHAHYISRRFAEFACSILLILNKKKTSKSKLINSNSSARRKSVNNSSNNNSANTSTDNTNTSTTDGSTTPGMDNSRRSSSFHNDDNLNHSNEKSAGDMLLKDLNDMLDEFVVLLERLADEHNKNDTESAAILSTSSHLSASTLLSPNKKRIIFLINNFDHVVCIFQERQVVGNEFNKLIQLLMNYREVFVEEELLSVGFSKMIAFVQQTESYLNNPNNNPNNNNNNINMDVVQSLVYDFKNTWKQHLEQINRNVLSYFSNFRNGMEILKQVLTQLLLYYTRFQDILRKVWGRTGKQPSFCKDLVNTSIILAEIKKYALAI